MATFFLSMFVGVTGPGKDTRLRGLAVNSKAQRKVQAAQDIQRPMRRRTEITPAGEA
ncbi:hypothetical protein K1718_20235 [Roseibium porphyridii]|uniref:Uncharacterized protein n=1 Tax=Roseibium porphyridii TaxID=2866279 RepID=A0ABY8F143_9HYPH|nr:hypothetical protein [Roseibium sp. KMA01]WFE88474.1 hypothetical protein K1718_20235 [Roseibium sp. KMA01]